MTSYLSLNFIKGGFPLNSEIMDILQKLNRGEISPKKAVSLVKEYKLREISSLKQSSKIRITISDKKEGKTIKIPAIPYWLVTSLGNLGLKLSSFALRNNNSEHNDSIKYLESIQELDLTEIFNILKVSGPCDIVHITDGEDGSEVRITTL